MALGAGKGQILRMLAAEAALLSGAAVAAGLLLANGALQLLAPVIESRIGLEAPAVLKLYGWTQPCSRALLPPPC